MIVFYYRFVLDVLYGLTCRFPDKISYQLSVTVSLWTLFVVLSIYFSQTMLPYRSFIVYLALPWSNIGACRSIIALSISLERVIAAYFPLKYRSYRCHFPSFIILSIGILFGLFEIPMLFVFCNYRMVIPPGCRIFGCSMNQCFRTYWTGHRAVNSFL